MKNLWKPILSLLILFNIHLISGCKEDEPPIAPTVTTGIVSDLTSNSAKINGEVTADGGATVTERGIVWGTTSNPTVSDNKAISGSGVGTFTSNLTNLTSATTYFVRAFATNSVGTSYGGEINFKTSAVLASVTTINITAITSISATSGGNVTDDGGADITARGVCWSTSPNPTISNSKTTDGNGKGSFSSSISSLSNSTKYYVRAYATNSIGTSYGNEVNFTTLAAIPSNGLVAWYPFNGNANDESGNGKNGTIVGGVSLTSDRRGNSNAAYLFNGTTGYIDVSALNNLSYTPITYSAWVIVKSYFPSSAGHKFKAVIGRNTDGVLENGVIGFFADGNVAGGAYDNTFLMWRGGGANPPPYSVTIPTLNTWHHIVYTQSNVGDWKWYYDGILTNSGNFTDVQNDFNYFRIGGCNVTSTGNTFWDDKIDDVGIWNRALSAEEVLKIYNGSGF